MALELLTDRGDEPSQVRDVNLALVPLGTPLLAGPGAIVATIVFVQQAEEVADYTAIAAGILAIHLAVYLSLRFSVTITKVIRESGIVLLTRSPACCCRPSPCSWSPTPWRASSPRCDRRGGLRRLCAARMRP